MVVAIFGHSVSAEEGAEELWRYHDLGVNDLICDITLLLPTIMISTIALVVTPVLGILFLAFAGYCAWVLLEMK